MCIYICKSYDCGCPGEVLYIEYCIDATVIEEFERRYGPMGVCRDIEIVHAWNRRKDNCALNTEIEFHPDTEMCNACAVVAWQNRAGEGNERDRNEGEEYDGEIDDGADDDRADDDGWNDEGEEDEREREYEEAENEENQGEAGDEDVEEDEEDVG